MVRTQGSQPCNRGSTPRGVTLNYPLECFVYLFSVGNQNDIDRPFFFAIDYSVIANSVSIISILNFLKMAI